MNINVSVIQMGPRTCDIKYNLSRMENLIEQAVSTQPETVLIVFPELITSGYECNDEFYKIAETVPNGESLTVMSGLAKKYGVHLIYGFPERDSSLSDVLYNSAALISDSGNVLGVYRKVHLFGSEKNIFRAGYEYPIFVTAIGTLGIMICWDAAFPEVARSYALKGAELLVVISNWEKPYADDWDLIVKARAFDNICYLAAANRVGPDQTLDFFGRSKIIDPVGKPIVELNQESEGVISTAIDYERALKLKYEYYTFFKDRRPDTYSQINKCY